MGLSRCQEGESWETQHGQKRGEWERKGMHLQGQRAGGKAKASRGAETVQRNPERRAELTFDPPPSMSLTNMDLSIGRTLSKAST